MPYCIHCGNEVKEDQEICLHCGCYAKPKMEEKDILNVANNEKESYDADARQGLLFSLVGIFIPILMIVGLIFSIKGLYSTRYKHLALIGIIIPIFYILFIVVVFFSFALFI